MQFLCAGRRGRSKIYENKGNHREFINPQQRSTDLLRSANHLIKNDSLIKEYQ